MFLHTEKGYFYVSGVDKRFRIISERVLHSWSPQRVIKTTEAAVVKYRIAARLKFRNGSLIHNLADGKIYLISDGKRRQLISPDAFEMLGAKQKEVVTVSQEEMNLHELGDVIG